MLTANNVVRYNTIIPPNAIMLIISTASQFAKQTKHTFAKPTLLAKRLAKLTHMAFFSWFQLKRGKNMLVY